MACTFIIGERMFSTREAEQSVSRTHLSNLVKKGQLERIDRGIYCVSDFVPTNDLFEIEILLKRGTKFILALQSALKLYGFTTALPSTLEIALPLGARIPKVNFPLSSIHLSGASWEYGQSLLPIDGVNIPIFTAAKTVADLFKFRNRLGLELAIEGLREGIRGKYFTPNEFIEAAKVDRVAKFAMPYLESLF